MNKLHIDSSLFCPGSAFSQALSYEGKTPPLLSARAWVCDLASQPVKFVPLVILAGFPSLACGNSAVYIVIF